MPRDGFGMWFRLAGSSLGLVGLVGLVASAGDLGIDASFGAGTQGAATYGALELQLDARWPGARLGLGLRAVWDDGVFRRADWSRAANTVTILRDVALVHELERGGHLALAAGRLAPAHVGVLADGYRSTLDDRWRTGVRTGVSTPELDVGVEIDDVLDPALIGGAMRWQAAPPWGVQVAVVADPSAPTAVAPSLASPTRAAIAVATGMSRRYESREGRADVGVAIVAELGLGFSGVGFVDGALVRDDLRWTLRVDARAGTGTVGAMFGPLYRVERTAHGGAPSLWERARTGSLDGGSLGGSIGATTSTGWLELGLRTRPGLGTLAMINGGAPMSRWVQAGVWAAASRDDGAGAAELRIAWTRQLFNALQVARIYRFTAMEPEVVWSVTAWFGGTIDR